jgi:PKD repeat protein/photosystem II stability/assembly factor-like uncharacterized protein
MSQEWVKNLSEEKVQNGSISFYDIQDAFNNYALANGIVEGKRDVNGTLEKVPGWKQFKRWEWYWEPRVNQQTGAFPETSATDEFIKYVKINPAAKSASGSWTSLGPSTTDGGYAGIGRVNCVAFHPSDNNTFWVGTPSGGLWKTSDGGSTWTVLTDGNAVLGVSDIVIPSDYATSNTIYIATGDRDGGSMWSLGSGARSDNCSVGVLKSTDGGTTWNTTGLSYAVSDNKRIGRLLVYPTDNNMLFAATSDGIKKTTNGGTSWTTVYSYSRQYYGDMLIDMEFKPGDPTVMYASMKDYGRAAKILKSTDSGNNWISIKDFETTDYRVEIAVTANDAEYLYAIVANTGSGLSGIFKSTDSGATFTQLVDGDDTGKAFLGYYSDGSGDNSGQGGYDLSIDASPTDKNTVLIGGVNTWKTTDGGTTWAICNMWTSYSGYNFSSAPVVHADKHTHVYRADGTLFEGNDGGIYKSTNNGTSWTDLSDGLRISQIYRLGVSQTDNNMTITGLQDNGSKLVDGNTWYDVTGGDGMECIIDFTDNDIQYATYVNGKIYRTTNLWSGSSTISDNISDEDKGAWVTPYIIDPNNHSTLYVGYADVWKSTDKGDSFTKISTLNTADLIRSMAIAPSNSNYLYVADHDNIWKTTNGGTLWTEITGTLPVTTNSITYIAVKNSDENTLWVTMGGYDTNRVYQSTDGGSTWVNMSAGLPNLPMMSIVQNKLQTATEQLYVGTDVGVYMKHGDVDWTLFSTGLPNVVVTELDIYYDNTTPVSSKLRAATFGRGLWESDLYTVPTVAPVAEFSANDSSVNQGQSVSFTDLSENEPAEWSWIFTGGTPAASTEQNPVVQYNTVGTFDVALTVSNSEGNDTETKTGFITVAAALTPVAGFTVSSSNAYVEQVLTFTDTSENIPTAWSWTFDGGTPASSTEQNPQVSYTAVGTYDVSLIVTNAAGSDEVIKIAYITIEEMPDLLPPTNLQAVATENFVDLSWEKPLSDTAISEGFEGTWIPDGWSVKYSATIDGSQSDPTEATWFHCDENSYTNGPNPEYIHSGTYSAGISYNAPEFNWLITPEFQAEVSTVLNYWLWYYSSSADGWISKFHVMVKDGTTWTSLKSYGSGSPNNEYNTMEVIGLGDYAGKTIQIAFVFEYSDGFQLMLDDVFIGFSNSGYKIYRNNAEIVTINDPETIDYKDSGLDAGNYEYYISAYYGETSNESAPSNKETVDVFGLALANFTATPTSGVFPLEVTFTNTSENATLYDWDFGDEEISTEQNPVHTYAVPGIYTVKLTASNPDNEDVEIKTDYITVTLAEVVASFTANPLEGEYPLEVTFTNASENATEYQWDFGDGTTSTDENPVHTYTDPDNYTVSLSASNSSNSDTETKSNYIVVLWPVPVADFTATPTSGVDPLEVTFTDASLFAQNWNWDFGDETVSSAQHPSHTFTYGTYTISLKVTNPTGSHSKIQENLIVVEPNSIPEDWVERLQVYPNPATDFIRINLKNDAAAKVSFGLFNMQGKMIYQSEPEFTIEIERNIDVKLFEDGNYLLKLSIGNDVIVLPILKN